MIKCPKICNSLIGIDILFKPTPNQRRLIRTENRVSASYADQSKHCSVGRKMNQMPDRFTPKQGQYMAFIYNYTMVFGRAPAERDLERFFQTTPPTIHQMILKLTEKGLISRTPGQARSIKLLIDPDEVPRLLPPKMNKMK